MSVTAQHRHRSYGADMSPVPNLPYSAIIACHERGQWWGKKVNRNDPGRV